MKFPKRHYKFPEVGSKFYQVPNSFSIFGKSGQIMPYLVALIIDRSLAKSSFGSFPTAKITH